MEEKFDFEKEMKRLDEIVANISSEKLPLDECLALYKKAKRSSKSLKKPSKKPKKRSKKSLKANKSISGLLVFN